MKRKNASLLGNVLMGLGLNRCATVTGGFATMTNVAAVAIIAVIANK